MKIKKIQIENYGKIETMEIDFDKPVLFLTGRNGKGKSTFVRALIWCLTGDGPDSSSFVTDGKSNSKVSVVIETNHGDMTFERRAKRGQPAKCYVNGKNCPIKIFNATLADETGIKADSFLLTTSQEMAASMKPEELMKTLMAMVPDTTSVNDVVKMISGYDEATMSQFIKSYCDDKSIDPNSKQLSNDLVADMYANFYAQKSATFLKIREMKDKIDEGFISTPRRKKELIKKEMDEIADKEARSAMARQALKNYEEAVAQRKNAEDRVRLQMNVLSSMGYVPKPDPSVKENMLKKVEDIRANQAFSRKMLGSTESNIATLQKALSDLANPVCPLSGKLKCTTDKTAVHDDIVAQIEQNKVMKEELAKNISDDEKKISEISVLIKVEDENEAKYKDKLALEKQIEQMKSVIPPKPVQPTAKLVEFDFSAKKAELEKELEYFNAFEKNETYKAILEQAQRAFESLDVLVKALAPKGEVLTALQNAYLAFFNNAINARAKSLVGRTIEVNLVADTGVKLQAKFNNGEFHYYNELSRGERLVVIFLLLDLFNSLYGTRVLVLDDLNHLDGESFSEFIDMIFKPEIMAEYDHIILCAASNKDIDDKISSIIANGNAKSV